MDLSALIAERPLILDGGLGRALMERGFQAGECPEEWNVSHPAEVEDIHRSFYAAGSDIVNTNTFGGTAMRLEAHGLSARAVELSKAGARLATGVRDREFPGRWVAGDIGPCGAMTAHGRRRARRPARHVRRAGARPGRRRGGPPQHRDDVRLPPRRASPVEEAVRVAGGRPVLASMTFKPAAKGFRTMMGVSPEAAVKALKDAGADLVGCNCGITCEPMAELVAIMAELGGGVTYAQPNAGQPRLEGGRPCTRRRRSTSPPSVATYPALGAKIIGGCCGTPPASIAALAAALGR